MALLFFAIWAADSAKEAIPIELKDPLVPLFWIPPEQRKDEGPPESETIRMPEIPNQEQSPRRYPVNNLDLRGIGLEITCSDDTWLQALKAEGGYLGFTLTDGRIEAVELLFDLKSNEFVFQEVALSGTYFLLEIMNPNSTDGISELMSRARVLLKSFTLPVRIFALSPTLDTKIGRAVEEHVSQRSRQLDELKAVELVFSNDYELKVKKVEWINQ